MYSKSLTLRRNETLKHRYELKARDPSIQGYVRYPATLMIKRAGERKYRVEKEFALNLILLGALRILSLRS